MAKNRKGEQTSIRNRFEEEIGYPIDFYGLFEGLHGVSFFVKNRLYQLVAANRVFFERLGFRDEHEIIGKQDFELFPDPLASKFREDDAKVIRTGEPMPDTVELFLTRHGLPEWYVTNKRPVFSLKGKVVGVMGTVQRYDKVRGLESSHAGITKAVKLMLSDPGLVTSVSLLASELKMSLRNFDRRFKEDTGLTPKQFLSRARIQRACKLLQSTSIKMCDLAAELGFCDQSAFALQFRERMGITPLRYRKTYRQRG